MYFKKINSLWGKFGVRPAAFLAELRESSEARKRRWLYGLSGASMATVFAFWLMYMNVIVPVVPSVEPSVAPGADVVRAPAVPAEEREGTDVWKTFTAGVRVVAEELGGAARRVKELFSHTIGAPKEIRIENATERNFILDTLPQVSPASLP